MNEATVQKVTAELTRELTGQKFGKIFVLKRLQIAVDFRLSDGKYLFISIEPTSPRVYFVKRKLKELEKASDLQLSFVSFLRKKLAHSVVEKIEKIDNERIIIFQLNARNELGQIKNYYFVLQLTGRSSNIFLLDERKIILDSLRETYGAGQSIAGKYSPPVQENKPNQTVRRNWQENAFPQNDFKTLSESLDNFYLQKK